MSLQPELYIGRIVEVVFVDHVWGDETELMLCRIWGKMIKSDWQKVILQVWETNDSETDNAEYATLIRAAIHSMRLLQYEEK